MTAVATGTTSADGTSIVGLYGTFTIGSNGTYRYVVNNNNATVNALAAGETISEVLTYQMSDAAGATDVAEIRITVTGANDSPTVTAAAATATLVEAGGVANGTVGTATSSISLTKGDADGTASYDTAAMVTAGWTAAEAGVTYTKTGTYGTATLTISTGVVSYALNNTVPYPDDPVGPVYKPVVMRDTYYGYAFFLIKARKQI